MALSGVSRSGLVSLGSGGLLMNETNLRQWAVVLKRPLLFMIAILAIGYGAALLLERSGVDAFSTDVPRLAAELRAWGPWSALASIVMMVLHSALPLPGEIIALANGLIFGPILGAAITWIGAMLGAVVAFLTARAFGRNTASLPVDPHLQERVQRACTRPTTLLALRLAPVISFNLINYVAGLCGVGWWTFLWTTSIGILPMILGMSYFGQAMLDAPMWAWGLLAIFLALSPALASLILRRRVEKT